MLQPSMTAPSIQLTSDRTLRIAFPADERSSLLISPLTLRAACQAIAASPLAPCIDDIVPAASTITIHLNLAASTAHPVASPQAFLAHSTDIITTTLRSIDPAHSAPGKLHTIPVRYGNALGPDLQQVAAQTNLSPQRIIQLHTSTEYTVSFLGFSPGFAYLEGLPDELRVPRLASPRPRVPAGSVAVAGSQTAIYPQATPGGWSIIGHTTTTLFDQTAYPPNLLQLGDRVRFIIDTSAPPTP